MVTKTLLISI